MSELPAKDLIEAMKKVKAALPTASVCVTSLKGELAVRQNAEPTSSPIPLPMTIIGCADIESDHGFFFQNMEEAQEFLKDVAELKRENVPLEIIVDELTRKLRGK